MDLSLCYSIKHHFRNHNEAIVKNTAFFSERTHTDIKGNMNYFKCYTSANIFQIFSMRDHSSRDVVSQGRDYYFSDKKTRSKLCTMLPGVLFSNCFLLISGTFLNQADHIQKQDVLKFSNKSSFSAFIPFEFLISFIFNFLQKNAKSHKMKGNLISNLYWLFTHSFQKFF